MITTYDDIKNYVTRALAAFDKDPPDSDYQKGYQAALRELAKEMNV